MKQIQKTQSKKKSKKKTNTKSNSVNKPLPELPSKTKEYFPLDANLMNPISHIKKITHSLKRTQALLVVMEMSTGFIEIFYVYPKNESFTYKGGTYYVEDEFKKFIPTLNVYALMYHQELSPPIQFKINVSELKRDIVGAGYTNIDMAMNPKSLMYFIKSQIVQAISKGAMLDAFFRFMRLIAIITLLIVIIHFVMFAQVSGLLDNLGI